MTTATVPPFVVEMTLVSFTETKDRAKRRIRVLAQSDRRLHRMQRQVCRGRLMHTRSVQWAALTALMSQVLERCRIAIQQGEDTSAHRTIEAMWWNSDIHYNTPAARKRITSILLDAIDWCVLPTNLSEWPALAILALYPRSSAHLIAGSSGYATADHAARIVAKGHCYEADFCEWVDSLAERTSDRESYLRAMQKATRKVFQNCMANPAWSPRSRRHGSYYTSYPRGRVEVLMELLDLNRGPKFAAWF